MKNKTIVISGANGNVGSFFAKKLADGNRLILLIHNNQDRLNALINHQNVRIAKTELTHFDQSEQVLHSVIKQTDWIPEILIHTASRRSDDFQKLQDSDIQKWNAVIQTNLIGSFHLLKIILPYLQKMKFGRILLFGSNVSRIGLNKGSAYAASKAALANLCRSVATEIASENILINTISPGPIQIDDSHFSPNYRKFREQYYESERKKIPLQRICQIEEVYDLSMYLLSDKNTYLTGEEVFITGGTL